ncbi:MAG: filamentous hemagglutinin N-terminal domain-containing protein, partial [Oceanospirillaceae bacterium]|nr:filamentous hemagglutinin N-terminal domain-containing protein [Oceanospirillaceae bacterium]
MNGLNRTFRIIWSRTLKRLVVCGELAKSRGSDSAPTRVVRSSSVVRRFALSILCSALGLASLASYADPVATELPQGAQIAAGAAAVSVDGSKLTVTQSSDKAIINWNSFNIGAQAEVRFDQPSSSSAVLNRVLAADPSVIQGKLSSNGQVFLINPNGVLFGETARVDVGALVASTLNISDENFLNEHFKFSGNPVGSVVNKGSLTGGFVALIGPEVDNQGYILARVDDVALIAGDSVTLDLDGSSLVAIEVEASKLRTAVKNSGSIEAPEGSVVLTANAAQSLIDDLINTPQQSADELVFIDGVPQLVSNSGTIKAPQIELSAGEFGATSVSGTLDVSSDSGVGGTVEVTGKAVLIEETAVLDATGPLGGGEILVGGDWQGTGETLQATYATVEHGAVLDASATANGDGGKVVVWSDIYDPESRTIVAGSLLAKGGPLSGDGGQIETSGHFLNVDHAEGDASSFQGLNGEWLFDPYSFRVVASADGSYTASGTNYTAINNDGRDQAASLISATTIQTALNNGSNVIVKSLNGSIILETSITSTGSGNLTFSSADNRFTVLLADITLAGGDLLFTSTSGSNASRFAAAFMGNSNQTITTQGGSVTFGGSVLLANGSGLSINTMGSSTAGDLVFVGEVNSANRFTLTSEAKSLTVWKSDSLYNGTSLAVDASYAATLTSLSENALATAVLSIGGYSDTAWFGLEENPAYDGQSSQYRWWAGPEIGDPLGSLNVWGSSEPNNNTVGGLDGAVIGWGDSTGGSYEKWDDQGASAVHKLLYETNLSNTPLTIYAGTGTVVFNSDIGSTRGLGNLTISSAKNVSFKGKVDGSFGIDATVASDGSFIFNDAVGSNFALSEINIGSSGRTYLNSSVTTTGTQHYANDIYVGVLGVEPFENGDFSNGFEGWTYSNTPVFLGTTVIGGFASPDDTTYDLDTQSDRGSFAASGISTTITETGVVTMYTGSGNCATAFCTVRGPYLISDASVTLGVGDSVSFDWKAEYAQDAYDAYGYLLNTLDGTTINLLDSTGTTTSSTNWATSSYTLTSAAQAGNYRFVFVAGSYDLSGGRGLGGKLSVDNIQNTSVTANLFTAPPCSNCNLSASSFNAQKSVVLSTNTLNLQLSSASEINGVVSGSGGISLSGTGSLVLKGDNTYQGTTSISAGATLSIGNGSSVGSLSGNLENAGKVVFDRSDAYEYAGDISGTGEIEKALNTGDLTLSGALSFSGQTAIRSGNLIIENDAAPSHNSEYLGPGSLIVRPKSNDFSSAVSTANWGFNTTNPIANLTIGNSSASADGTSDATVTLGSETVVSGGVWLFGNDVAIAADVTAQTINIKASDSIYINSAMLDTSGVISLVSDYDSSGAGSIEVFSSNLSSGGGNITFSGGSSGTGFAQGTNTEQGTRSIYRGVTFDQSTIDASGTSTGGDILVKGRGLQTGSTDYSLGVELLRDVTIRTNKDGAITIYGEGGAHSGSHFAAGINLHRANEIITEAGAIILDGKAYATGTTSYYGINFDTYASDAANAIYSQSGNITLSGSDGGAGSYGVGVHTNAKPVYLGWDGSGVSPTITSGTLTISGEAINLSSNISVSAADVKFNTASASTFGGTINGISQLTKLGTASLTLSGASSYSGDTNVSAGGLILTHADALGAITGDTNVASGATLDVRGVTLAAEPITLNGGTLATSSGNSVVSGSVTLTANSSISITGTQLLASGVISGDYALSLSGSGKFIAAASNTFSGTLTIASGSTLQIGNGGTSGSLVADVINNGTVQYNRSDSLELTSDISGNGALRQSGSGVLVLTGNNTYTGGTTIDSGSILQIGAGGSGGSISGSIANAGTLEFKRSGSLSYGGIISGTGQVKVTGSGTISLSGANTYTGATYVSGGELRISGDGVLGNENYTSVLDVSAGASLVFASTANQTVAKLQGAGAFGVSGSGEFTLSGDQAFAGDISVGQLMVLDNGTNNNISGIGNANAITINNGGTIELAGSNNNSFIGSRRSGGPAISILTGGLLTTANDSTVRTFHLGTDLTLAGGELGWGQSGSQYVSQWGTWNVNGDIYVTENS